MIISTVDLCVRLFLFVLLGGLGLGQSNNLSGPCVKPVVKIALNILT